MLTLLSIQHHKLSLALVGIVHFITYVFVNASLNQIKFHTITPKPS